MTVWNKLWTAVRGGANEAAEAVADSQALRILDQEIRDADTALGRALDERAKIAAKRKMKEDSIAATSADIEKYSAAALSALEQGKEDLARQTAERIAALESQLTADQTVLAEYQATEQNMAAAIKQTEAKIENLKREVEAVKATEALQSAQAAVANRHAGVNSSLGSAADSLSRLKEKQAERAARMQAAEEIDAARNGGDLDAKLAEAGIGGGASSSADDILAKLKSKSG